MANRTSEQAISTITATRPSVEALATQFLNTVLWRNRNPSKPKRIKRTTLPWEPWELDANFLETLSKWTRDNPETSLDRVLDNICYGLENFKELFQLIPDNPFPARGLVTALAHLFKLGVKLSRAKKDVQGFAKDVVRWVGLVKSSFESPEAGYFTWQAWKNLQDMRDLINEICLWAVDRLDDGRWSRITHGLMIQKEIQEFKDRIADARALFRDLSAINQATGLDAIMQNLIYLFQYQQITFIEIQKIRETQDKHFEQIMSELEMQKQAAERDRFFAQTLNVRTVANPSYDSQGKRPCDEDTRQEVLDEIRNWTNDISPGTPNFLWLTGDPGCGKSAVTASLARDCKDQGVLWAQFFINRNNSETTDPRSYFPSIARQLADYSPEVAETIHQTLQEQRSLVDDISANQAAKLFVNSVCKASQLYPDRPVVVVIDGLDETSRDRLEDTAKIFSTLFAALHAHGNVKVMISSRTENEIQKSFSLPSNNKRVKHVHLDTSHPSSIRDVSQYIKRNLLDLVREHDLNWDVWPGDQRSRALGERATGLFIWAVTAIKFIQERLQSDGQECLNDVLDLLTADVLYDINALYTLILKVMHGTRPSSWELERFRRIVGAIVSLQEPLCIDDLAALLDLRRTPTSSPADLRHFVRRFRTILVTGTDVIDGNTIPRIHKSVYEFITSDAADTRFRVQPVNAHLELGIQCLAHLGIIRESVIEDTLPMQFRYASRFWSSHFSQANVMNATSVCADYRYTPSMSRLSLPQYIKSVPFVHKPMHVRSSVTTSQMKTIAVDSQIWDAVNGHSISHTAHISCMVFSPDGRQIASCSHDKTIQCWDSSNGGWMRTLVKYSNPFNAIAFCPDGASIVSGSDDGLVRLWDYSTGAPIGDPFKGHEGNLTCISVSPDGERIISGSEDNACILWNVHIGSMVGKPWTGHKFPVELVAFSASGRRACSIDNTWYGFVWDVATGQHVGSWHYSGATPRYISFSPTDDDLVAVGGGDGIEIRFNGQKWSIPDSDYTKYLSFSPDGKEIIFVSDGTISVAEIGEDEQAIHLVRKGNYHRSDLVYSPTLSPDFGHLAFADERHGIHVYALQHGKKSLKVIPVDEAITSASQDEDRKELVDVLLSMEAQHNHNAAINNSRLNAVKWYQYAGVARSVRDMLLVRDNAIIAGRRSGSVSVWELGRLDEQNSYQVNTRQPPQ